MDRRSPSQRAPRRASPADPAARPAQGPTPSADARLPRPPQRAEALPARPLPAPAPRPVPMVSALEQFMRELQAALAAATAELADLRQDLAQTRQQLDELRQRHATHGHPHALTATGGGGRLWVELQGLPGMLDALEGHSSGLRRWGFWLRETSTPEQPPAGVTGAPSA